MKLAALNKETEKTIFITAINESDGVKIVATNNVGDQLVGGSLLSIKNSGKIILIPKIHRDLGFDLDEEGRIKIGK